MITLADLIIRHVCERPDGGPDKLDHPDTIITTVSELREAVERSYQVWRRNDDE